MKIQFGSDTNLVHFFDDGHDLEYFEKYEADPSGAGVSVETWRPDDVRELAESYGGDVVEL